MARNTVPASYRLRPAAASLGSVLGMVGLLLFCVLLGMLMAVAPVGVSVRLLVIPLALGFLILTWAMRTPRAGMPGRWVLLLLLGTVVLSVVWPRYVFFSIGGPYVNPQTLSVFASLATILAWLAYSPAFSKRVGDMLFSSTQLGLLTLAWLAWRLLAAVLGEYPVPSTVELLREIVYLASFLLVGVAVATYDEGPKWMLRVLLLAGVAVGLVGLVEAFQQKNHFVQFAAGRDSAAVADAIKTIALEKIRGGAYRAQSTFDHPIVFAQFVAAMVPVAAYALLYERGLFWRLLGLVFIPIGTLAIVKSGSRAGLISLAVAILFVGVVIWLRAMRSKGFGKAAAIAALPLFLFGLLVAYVVVQELVLGRTQVEAGSTSVRMKMLSDGVQALADSPLIGFGQGMAITKAGVINPLGQATIDSLLLTIMLDAGYVGLLLFMLLFGWFCAKGAAAAVQLPGVEGARVGLIVAAVLAVLSTFVGLSIPNNMTLLWLLIASALPSIIRSQQLKTRR